MRSKEQTDLLESYRTKYPALDALWVALSEGYTPNFLDIMAAISECVDFEAEPDADLPPELCKIFDMSGIKCRNCS